MDLHADHERGMVDVDAAQAHAAAAGLSVDAENVLYVRKAILDEYEALLAVLGGESRDAQTYARPYGGDPVSVDASVAFPQRANSLLSECRKQVMELLAISDHLKDAALAYGFTEEQIASANPVNVGAGAAQVSATLHAILNPWERG